MVETELLDWLTQKSEWAGLSSIGAVKCERQVGEKVTRETRYFISSLRGSVTKFASAVRAHWGIENRLHWVLDVATGEDDCGIWQNNAPENLATLRKIVMNLLRQDKKNKRGLKARSKRASWDNDYLLRIMLQTSDEDKTNN
jgi:predicted transposase YbfD/YdcC